MMRRLRAAFVSICVVVTAGALLAGVLGGRGRPSSLADRVHEVASGLRCPVCLNVSVADSTSGVARQMRRTIADELRTGMSPDRIQARFVSAYGEWILIEPPKRGLGLTIWLVPLVFVLAGAVGTAVAVRRWAGRHVPDRDTPPPDGSPA